MALCYSLKQFSTVVNNLGVLIDSQLSMADHVAAVSRSGFFQLRQLRSVRQPLTLMVTKTLILAFISSQIDYCNQLLVGVSALLLDKLLCTLQYLQKFSK